MLFDVSRATRLPSRWDAAASLCTSRPIRSGGKTCLFPCAAINPRTKRDGAAERRPLEEGDRSLRGPWVSGVGPGGHGDPTRRCFSTLLFVRRTPPGRRRRRSGKIEAHKAVRKGYKSQAAEVDYMGVWVYLTQFRKSECTFWKLGTLVWTGHCALLFRLALVLLYKLNYNKNKC